MITGDEFDELPPMTVEQRQQLIAAADVIGRMGASLFEVGYLDDDAGRWYASARYAGRRVTSEAHASPWDAADTLARTLMDGGGCKCARRVTLDPDTPGCLWTRTGDRWSSSCAAEPIVVGGVVRRGDLNAMRAAYGERVTQVSNRADRRAKKPRRP